MAGLTYFNEGPFTGVAGEALAAYRRVKLSAGTWVYADMADEGIAITGPLAVASGDQVTLYPCNSGGIVPVTGDGVIAAGSLWGERRQGDFLRRSGAGGGFIVVGDFRRWWHRGGSTGCLSWRSVYTKHTKCRLLRRFFQWCC